MRLLAELILATSAAGPALAISQWHGHKSNTDMEVRNRWLVFEWLTSFRFLQVQPPNKRRRSAQILHLDDWGYCIYSVPRTKLIIPIFIADSSHFPSVSYSLSRSSPTSQRARITSWAISLSCCYSDHIFHWGLLNSYAPWRISRRASEAAFSNSP
jgi:hypothetical protein